LEIPFFVIHFPKFILNDELKYFKLLTTRIQQIDIQIYQLESLVGQYPLSQQSFDTHQRLFNFKLGRFKSSRKAYIEAIVGSLIEYDLNLKNQEISKLADELTQLTVTRYSLDNSLLGNIAEGYRASRDLEQVELKLSMMTDIQSLGLQIKNKREKLSEIENLDKQRTALKQKRTSIEKSIGENQKKLNECVKNCIAFNDEELEQASRRATEIGFFIEELERDIQSLEDEKLDDSLYKGILSEISRTEQLLTDELIPKRNQLLEQQQELRRIEQSIMEQIKREEQLRRRIEEITNDLPKLEFELDNKDELIANITAKQLEINSTIHGDLIGKYNESKKNFSVWDDQKNQLNNDTQLLTEEFEYLQTIKQHDGEYSIAKAEYYNFTRTRNETFLRFHWAEESWKNSTEKVHNLVHQFKQSEKYYFQKEAELAEYNKKVEAGEIEKVNFKFEY
jgi:hypothetical protein